MILLAAGADPGKGQLTAGNMAAGVLLCFGFQTLGKGQLRQIQDRAAAGADEMNVGTGVRVETLHPVHGPQTPDQTLPLEQTQVPVDRGQGDIGVFRLEHPVEILRRGVDMGAAQAGEDGVSLAELLDGLFHSRLLSVE